MIAGLTLRRTAVLAVNAALAVLLGQQLAAPPPQIPSMPARALPSGAPPPAPAKSSRTAPADDTPGRDLFLAEESAAPAEPPPPEPPATAPELQLIGTALGDPSFAVLRNAVDATSQRIREGDAFGDWRLDSVRRNAVILSHGRSRWRVGFAPAHPAPCATEACVE